MLDWFHVRPIFVKDRSAHVVSRALRDLRVPQDPRGPRDVTELQYSLDPVVLQDLPDPLDRPDQWVLERLDLQATRQGLLETQEVREQRDLQAITVEPVRRDQLVFRVLLDR